MRTRMNTISAVLAAVATTLLFASLATAASINIQTKEGIGKYLTDDKGMTLYVFKKDAPGKSACAGPCVEKWPLFSAENPSAPAGTAAGDFAAITRDDGKKQATYKGLPLYYFFKDTKAGDTAGQGVNNVWYVAAP
jgi:predicted lipoprotein with Yx(FWY)xxD motif